MSPFFTAPRLRHIAAAFSACCLLSSAAIAAERPRIGLVLGGGGARGLAHIGVLEQLERLNVPINCIAGTSAGALVGGMYSSGLSVPYLIKSMEGADWNRLLRGSPPRRDLPYLTKETDNQNLAQITLGVRNGQVIAPTSIIGSQAVDQFIRQLTRNTNVADFNTLPIPFQAVATNLVTGDMHTFTGGDLATAMRASMAVPGVFPTETDGENQYIDGMFVRNLPVQNLMGSCADIIIAIDVGTPMLKADQIHSLLDVAAQAMSISTAENVRQQRALLRPQDILIEPALDGYSTGDFAKAKDLIQIGRESVPAHEAKLRALSVPPAEYAQWTAAKNQRIPTQANFAKVEVKTDGFVPAKMATDALLANGEPTTQAELEKRIDALYNSGDYDRIDYVVRDENGQRVADVTPVVRAVGPNYLRFGLEFELDSYGRSDLALLANYQQTWLNSAGGQWRNDLRLGYDSRLTSEFYQPFAANSPWFVATNFRFGSQDVPIFSETKNAQELLDFRVYDTRVGLDLGYSLGRFGEMRTGAFYDWSKTDQHVGILAFDNIRINAAGIDANIVIDQLDNRRFPRKGYYMLAGVQGAQITNKTAIKEGWMNTAQFDADIAQTFDTWSLRGSIRSRGNFNDDITLPTAALGGFLQLSGLKNDQLRGQSMFLGRAMAYKQISTLSPVLGSGAYIGGSLEAGKVWEQSLSKTDSPWVPSASAFVSVDTLLGPLYLGGGWSDYKGGNWGAYLYLGYTN